VRRRSGAAQGVAVAGNLDADAIGHRRDMAAIVGADIIALDEVARGCGGQEMPSLLLPERLTPLSVKSAGAIADRGLSCQRRLRFRTALAPAFSAINALVDGGDA
jgi:hypothetical protein